MCRVDVFTLCVDLSFRPSNGAVDERSSEQTASQNYDDGPEGMAPDGVIEVVIL